MLFDVRAHPGFLKVACSTAMNNRTKVRTAVGVSKHDHGLVSEIEPMEFCPAVCKFQSRSGELNTVQNKESGVQHLASGLDP